jgi:uncharacterized protein (TIGR03000 family)
MKRLLFAASAVVIALVMNGAILADGHGKGHGGGGDHGWHGGPVWSNGWKGDWDEGYWRQGYYYNPYFGYGNPWYGYGNWTNVFSNAPGAFAGPGYFAPAFRPAGFLAPAYGSFGSFAPAIPAVPGNAQAVAPASPAIPAAPGNAQALAPASPPVPGSAPRVQVVLPNPEAEVTIGGQKMNSLGMVRNFELPPVEPGKTDTYKVTATWTDGGNTFTDVRKVSLTPGSAATVDFTQPAPLERVATPVKSAPDTQEAPAQVQSAPPR